MILPDPPILVITNRRQCSEPLEMRTAALFQGGCRWLSVREKDLAPNDRLALLRRLMRIGQDYGARVGVHGDTEAAALLGIPLHLPAVADVKPARALLGHDALIGQSCHDGAELAGALAAGVQYATLSPTFESASKPGYRPMFDVDDLAAITAKAGLPVIALGGIAVATLPRLAGSGIAGLAVMGEAMRSPDPTACVARLVEAWRRLPA